MSDATADLLSEFLEISVQQILVSRKVYPPQLFVKCRKYGLPLYQSKHSALAHYLNDLMESVRAFIRRGSLDKFVLSLLLNNQVVERFIFEVRTPSLPTPISDQSIEAIVQSFRSALVKLISLPCSSHNSSEDAKSFSFDCSLHVTDVNAHDQRVWISSDCSEALSATPTDVFPIEMTALPCFCLNIFVEHIR